MLVGGDAVVLQRSAGVGPDPQAAEPGDLDGLTSNPDGTWRVASSAARSEDPGAKDETLQIMAALRSLPW
jgi:hypothetical protein